MPRATVVLRIAALLTIPLLNAYPLAAQRRAVMTVEDVLAMRQVGSPAISPDGSLVAYVVTVR